MGLLLSETDKGNCNHASKRLPDKVMKDELTRKSGTQRWRTHTEIAHTHSSHTHTHRGHTHTHTQRWDTRTDMAPTRTLTEVAHTYTGEIEGYGQ